MPTVEQILAGLSEIADKWRVLAIVWHVYFGALALGLVVGARPSKRLAGILLGLPLLSVSALAWVSGNPFNGTFFALSGAALIVISSRLPRESVSIGPLWAVIPGAFMFIFGWVYPHFLDTSSFLAYLYSAPTGLIPCPTLSIVIGLALVLGGCGSRAWSIVAGIAGVFYGIFGAIRLGVALDWVLLLGAVMIILAVFALTRPKGTGGAATPTA
jgi:hypothetical protein